MEKPILHLPRSGGRDYVTEIVMRRAAEKRKKASAKCFGDCKKCIPPSPYG